MPIVGDDTREPGRARTGPRRPSDPRRPAYWLTGDRRPAMLSQLDAITGNPHRGRTAVRARPPAARPGRHAPDGRAARHRCSSRDPPRDRLGPYRRDHRHHEHDSDSGCGDRRARRAAPRHGRDHRRSSSRPRRPRRAPRSRPGSRRGDAGPPARPRPATDPGPARRGAAPRDRTRDALRAGPRVGRRGPRAGGPVVRRDPPGLDRPDPEPGRRADPGHPRGVGLRLALPVRPLRDRVPAAQPLDAGLRLGPLHVAAGPGEAAWPRPRRAARDVLVRSTHGVRRRDDPRGRRRDRQPGPDHRRRGRSVRRRTGDPDDDRLRRRAAHLEHDRRRRLVDGLRGQPGAAARCTWSSERRRAHSAWSSASCSCSSSRALLPELDRIFGFIGS